MIPVSNAALTRGAFTLIELLVVVAIIGVLAAIAIVNFQTARVKAMVARVNGDLNALSLAVKQFKMDNDVYLTEYNLKRGVPRQRLAHSAAALLNVLSTPIAYLSSSEMVDDPFQKASWSKYRRASRPKDIIDQDYEKGQRYGWLELTKDNAERLRYTDPLLFSKNPQWSVWRGAPVPHNFDYDLVSRGPDLQMNIDIDEVSAPPPYRQVFLVYDPSNGTYSRGDIHELGP